MFFLKLSVLKWNPGIFTVKEKKEKLCSGFFDGKNHGTSYRSFFHWTWSSNGSRFLEGTFWGRMDSFTSQKRTRVNLEFPLKCAFTGTALYPLPFGAVKLVFFRGEWGHSNLCKRRYRPCYDFTPITDLLISSSVKKLFSTMNRLFLRDLENHIFENNRRNCRRDVWTPRQCFPFPWSVLPQHWNTWTCWCPPVWEKHHLRPPDTISRVSGAVREKKVFFFLQL